MVMGKRLGRANCAKAVDQAVEQTVYRLSQKSARDKLVDLTYNFFQKKSPTSMQQKTNVLANREELIVKLLELLPNTVIAE